MERAGFFKEDSSENELRSLEEMELLQNEGTYETTNLGHCFHTRISCTQILRGHFLEGVKANNWIQENLNVGVPYLDIFFVAKHKNAGKIESHLWFFKGFCSYL